MMNTIFGNDYIVLKAEEGRGRLACYPWFTGPMANIPSLKKISSYEIDEDWSQSFKFIISQIYDINLCSTVVNTLWLTAIE